MTKKTENTKATTKQKPKAVAKQGQDKAPAMNPPAKIKIGLTPAEQQIMTECGKRSKEIKAELGKVESAFNKIAFNLHWIYEHEAYKNLGCGNIYDFAKREFGIARGTCHNFINVVDRFAKRDENGAVIEQIDDLYKDFKSSQLILMLDLSDEEIKGLDANKSVRDLKKAIKEMTEESDSKESDTESEEEPEAIEVEAVEVKRQVLITIKNLEEYDSQEDKIYDMIRRALKDENHTVEIAYTWK